MNCITAYISGLNLIFSKAKLWLLLYVLNLIFAIFLAYPLSGVLETRLGNTLAADKLLKGFDFTIVHDFISEYGDLIALIMSQSLLAIVFYLFLSVFFAGGILTIFKNKRKPFRFATFWGGCSKYFWRMLRLTFYFILAQILLLGLFILLYYNLVAGGFDRFQNESQIIRRGLILLPFYLLISTVFFMIQDYAKIYIVETNSDFVYTPIRKAVDFIFNNFLQTFLLYLLNFATFGLLFLVYWHLDIGNAIFLTFLIGQLFVLARIGSKLLNLGSAFYLRLYYENR